MSSPQFRGHNTGNSGDTRNSGDTILIREVTERIKYYVPEIVERSLTQARKLYSEAKKDSPMVIWVYSPSVGSSPAGVFPINAGIKEIGLLEARKRLLKLKE